MNKSYRNALFISDLHLSEERPACNRAFFSFLEWVPEKTEALFILGDFFDYWVGDDLPSEVAQAVALSLRKLSIEKQIDLYFLAGNRDFAIGQQYCNDANMTLLCEESLFEIAGKTTAVSHGDIYCTDDISYQRYRKVIRHPWVLKSLLSLPKPWRVKIAEKLRQASKEKFQRSPYYIDVTPKAISEALDQLKCEILVHGHTHMADIHLANEPEAYPKRIVLGDWHEAGWYLELSESGERLHRFSIDAPLFAKN
ncbi:UDP-2,3-diacylglucosamine diphosphatase [Reinekea marina]|uniref:UDP-2,3-diacylglucosamine hydrolase n=1 Tax=Reinekea marina TaxID=1310421 RepID=A0ABV7WTQ0_9GAMM|nr:UDP-2,3-diacylglucosamine diphosphatase [Reinekea marina]MDN3649635.1 UDP-2,3-diacylglucosamine diphosphatase [Reinekea marina]